MPKLSWGNKNAAAIVQISALVNISLNFQNFWVFFNFSGVIIYVSTE